MFNQKLYETFLEHPSVATNSARKIVSQHANYGITVQDVYDTKEVLKRQNRGLISKRANNYKKRKGVIPPVPNLTASNPKILCFDLETAPMVSYHWRRFKENIGINQTISESFIICWSAKWLYSEKVHGDCVTPEEILNHDDSRVCKSLWKLIDEADVIVAHNGKKADIPWMNSRFLLNGLTPPSSYFAVDTLDIAKRKFGFSSNKLDALAGYLNIDHKLDTDFTLWRNCMMGSKEDLDYMFEYNQKDVVILEDVFIALRPWAGSMVPNMGNLLDTQSCASCGSESYEEIPNKYYMTPYNKYQLYRCKTCGAVFHGRRPIQRIRPIFNNCAH